MKNRNQIDEVDALANLAGDRKLLMELGQILCEDLPPLLCRLRIAMGQQDPVLTRSLIHKIKNLAATFFAREIVLLANPIELDCTQGDCDYVSLEKKVRRLTKMLNSLISEICDRGWSNANGDSTSSCEN